MEILADISQAGYEGTPPNLSIDRSAAETNELYRQYGLHTAPPYFSARFWQEDERDRVLAEAKRHARFVRELGCTELYVAPNGSDDVMRSGRTRAQAAGHVEPDDSLSDEEFERFAGLLNEVGAVTLGEGVRSCFHNHVGTVIETPGELDRLLSLVDDDRVFLGLDTGHLAWAGADVTAVCRRYADRIKTMHFKDIDEDVRVRGHAESWDYRTFSRNGIFTELGEGRVDFPTILTVLDNAGFSGWLIVETDVTQTASALESATISRNYLRGIGV
ncbi:MAG: TIM barrel protein [Thermomicrobiales bacterium]